MKVEWSDSAKIQLWKVIDYLYEKWTENEVVAFRNELNTLIENIIANPKICPQSKHFNLRKCLINKQNALIYLIENDTIIIVYIVDTRSSHSY